jgi:hypothetical protein
MQAVRVICCVTGVTLILLSVARAEESVFPATRSFATTDSLDVGDEPSADARECLAGLTWDSAAFDVHLEDARLDRGDVLVRYPSPVSSGDVRNDRVAMEWYVARDGTSSPCSAPAVIVVHESGSGMTAGRFIARGLQRRGLHTFLLHLPFYGERRTGRSRPDNVADVRRARDAVAVLPMVDHRHIALQGTSLGGFVCATAAGLDDGFQSVFLLLAGGDLYDLIQTGSRDTAKVREKLEEAGLTNERLRSLTQIIEPTRIAHRVDPAATWLYSGTHDSVVPIRNAVVLAEAAGLDNVHHIRMPANHYTGIVFLPLVLDHIDRKIRLLHAP